MPDLSRSEKTSIAVVRGYAADRDRIEQRIADAVAFARHDGASWEEIGAALGRSPTATETEYSYVDSPLWVDSHG